MTNRPMRLATTGCEPAVFTVSAAVNVPLEVSFDGGLTWHSMARETGTATVGVAGPDAVDVPLDAVVLHIGHNPAAVRLTNAPWVVIRPAGEVFVYALEP